VMFAAGIMVVIARNYVTVKIGVIHAAAAVVAPAPIRLMVATVMTVTAFVMAVTAGNYVTIKTRMLVPVAAMVAITQNRVTVQTVMSIATVSVVAIALVSCPAVCLTTV
jgi:hypothetical protein